MFRSYNDTIRTPLDGVRKAKANEYSITYFCDLCSEAEGNWLTEADVEIHRKNSHSTKVFKLMKNNPDRFCMICMRVQDSPKSLMEHIKSEHLLSSSTARQVEKQIYICAWCNRLFFNKELLNVHLQYKHMTPALDKSRASVDCPKCKKSVKVKALWYHLLLHEMSSPSLCQICLTNFQNLDELRTHLKTHSSHYFCPTCGYEATKDKNFKIHLNNHAAKPYVRKHIHKEKINQYYLSALKDVNLKYNIPNPFRGLQLPANIHICILCREICTDPDEKLLHILKDHNTFEEEKKKRHMCACGEEFFNSVLLKHHIFKLKDHHRMLMDHEIPVEGSEVSYQTLDYEEIIDFHGITDDTVEMTEIEVTVDEQDIDG